MQRLLATFLISASTLAFGTAVSARPGDLDPTFGAGGVVRTDLGYFDSPSDLAIQSDGRIVAAGTIDHQDGGNRNIFVVRYQPDGSLDSGFGVDGRIVPDRYHQTGPRIALQPDGRIVLATRGETGGGPLFLYRLEANGAPDATFGSLGIALMSTPGGVTNIAGVGVLANGRIVVGFWTSSGSGASIGVARFNGDGTADLTFGSGGALVVPSSHPLLPLAFELLSDGRMLAAGYAVLPGRFYTDAFVARLDAAGALDTGFDGDGIAVHQRTNQGTEFQAVGQALDGAVLAGGRLWGSIHGQNEWLLASFRPNGTPDPGFGSAGSVTFNPTAGDDVLADLAVTAAGVYATGLMQDRPLGLPAVSFTANGFLDPGFGTGGVTGLPGQYTGAWRLAVQMDGKIIVLGQVQTFVPTFNQDAYLARYLGDVTTAISPALVTAEAQPQEVRLSWCGAGAAGLLHVERTDVDGAWLELGTTTVDGTGCAVVEDRTVVPGERYGYRVAYHVGGDLRHSEVSWVDVPAGSLALTSIRPSPARGGDAWVSLTLPHAGPAHLSLLDVSGRLVRRVAIDGFGAGTHRLRLGGGLKPGVYWLRLQQEQHAAFGKMVVVN